MAVLGVDANHLGDYIKGNLKALKGQLKLPCLLVANLYILVSAIPVGDSEATQTPVNGTVVSAICR